MEKIEKILMEAESEGRYTLYESEVYEILKDIGMSTPKYSVIRQSSDLRKVRKNYGDKVVMKISSPDIMHKINVGGVKIVDNSARVLKNTYERMLQNVRKEAPNARITGVLLTEYVNIDHEVLVSMLYDEQFEHFITVGMGGVTTEIYKDISIRLPPVSEKDVKEMLQELKIYPIIQGYRGKKGANQERLIETILTLNTLAKNFSPCSRSQYIIKELEINPMACSGEKVIPVDGLLRFERKKAFKPRSKINVESIKNFFTPKSVAVIGATDDKRQDGSFKEGKVVMDNMLKSKIQNIYPVNPKKENVLGKKCYKSVKEIQDEVDLAVLLIPAKATPKVMEEVKEKGIKNAIIIGGGYSELGEEGKKLEERIKEISQEGNIRLLGPNCIGVYFKDTKLNTIFLPERKFKILERKDDNVALISQSGALAVNFVKFMQHVGLRYLISTGNMADSETDYPAFLKYFENEKETGVIGIYAEGFKDGRRLYEIAKNLNKPVIMLKGGKSNVGAKATASHTGAIAGNYEVARAAFKQANIVETETAQEFCDTLKIFSHLKDKKVEGNRVAIISNAGGLGILSTDTVGNSNLQLANYTEETKKELIPFYEEYLKENAGLNPTDLGAGISDENFITCLYLILKDPNVDGVIAPIGIEPQPLKEEPLINNIIRLSKETKKPVVITLAKSESSMALRDLMEDHSLPCYTSPERGVRALEKFITYHLNLKK